MTGGLDVPPPSACSSYLEDDADNSVGGSCGMKAWDRLVRRACSREDAVLPAERWVWRPTRCELPEWDAVRFCHALGPRRLLFIGDSTMHQLQGTLKSLLYEGYARRRRQSNTVAATSPFCGDNVFFSLSDTLVHHAFGSGNRGSHWLEPLLRLEPDIVVVSAGAHLNPPENHLKLFRTILGSVTRGWRKIKRRLVRPGRPWVPTLLWKTQSPGHDDCWHTGVVAPRRPGEPFHNSTKFNWMHFRAFDRIAREVFERGAEGDAPGPDDDTGLLDVGFLYDRPDAHEAPPCSRTNSGDGNGGAGDADTNRDAEPTKDGWQGGTTSSCRPDCLHFAAPGPLDTGARVLLNELELGLGRAHGGRRRDSGGRSRSSSSRSQLKANP